MTGGDAANWSDAEAERLIDQRQSGVLNAIMADTSAKARPTKQPFNDLARTNATDSIWDPWKQGMIACN